jgi:hypothetical protein
MGIYEIEWHEAMVQGTDGGGVAGDRQGWAGAGAWGAGQGMGP